MPFLYFDRRANMFAAFLALLFAGLLVFMIYMIIRMVFMTKTNTNNEINCHTTEIPFRASFDDSHLSNNQNQIVLEKANEVSPYIPESTDNTNSGEINHHEHATEPEPQAEPVQMPTTNELPTIVGQTPEEIKAPEPLQEKVDLKAEMPSPNDVYENSDNVALFGSNLRHPEGSIVRTKGSNFGNLENEIAAGLASQVSKPTELDRVQFSAEMAQNGGEFMNGIFAFDSSQDGSYFSSL